MIAVSARERQGPAPQNQTRPVVAEPPVWQHALRTAVRDPAELLALLGLGLEWLPAAVRAAQVFPLRVPRGFVARMRRGDPHDPLLRQVLPLGEEIDLQPPGYGADPVGDQAARRAPGLIQKYHGRALLTLTGACAVHCRYCFRRSYPYGDENPLADDLTAALAVLRADPTLHEIILSGGDPLMLPDHTLAGIVAQLATLPHITRLRVHTRLPVVLPERVDDALLVWLTGTRLTPVVVLHVNHAQEIGPEMAAACRRLRDAGVMLLNQSVLLRGVNDTGQALTALSERLFDVGVLPYYLHLLDRVTGAAHFEVPECEATRLHQHMQARLPGYLVPKLVREEAGQGSKLLICGAVAPPEG